MKTTSDPVELPPSQLVHDHALHLYDLEEALERGITRLYREATTLHEACSHGETPSPAGVLMALGGLRALLEHAQAQVESLARALDELDLVAAKGGEE